MKKARRDSVVINIVSIGHHPELAEVEVRIARLQWIKRPRDAFNTALHRCFALCELQSIPEIVGTITLADPKHV